MYYNKFNQPDDFAMIVEHAVNTLKDVLSRGIQFDTVVFRGFSGALVGPTVALQLGKYWALVRKKGDNSHSLNPIEGQVYGNYVIIDDFTDTGHTVKEILGACRDGTCVGAYFYDTKWFEGVKNNVDYLEERIGIPILNT